MKELTVAELRAKMDSDEEFQLIDVRERWEYEIANIGGTSIPMGDILIKASEIKTEIPVVIMCRSGNRSSKIIQVLELQKGLKNLINLKGGMQEWSAKIDPSMENNQ